MTMENTWRCTNCRCQNTEMVTVCSNCGLGREDSSFWKMAMVIVGMTVLITAVIAAVCLYLKLMCV